LPDNLAACFGEVFDARPGQPPACVTYGAVRPPRGDEVPDHLRLDRKFPRREPDDLQLASPDPPEGRGAAKTNDPHELAQRYERFWKVRVDVFSIGATPANLYSDFAPQFPAPSARLAE
jgi:hypothetical protein